MAVAGNGNGADALQPRQQSKFGPEQRCATRLAQETEDPPVVQQNDAMVVALVVEDGVLEGEVREFAPDARNQAGQFIRQRQGP
jgi:hypothetical protein